MRRFQFMMLCLVLLLPACAPKVKLFSNASDPLREFTLKGEGDAKILIIPVEGFISDQAKTGLLSSRPSMVQEIVSMLDIAEKDDDVKAVVLKINSPGGTVTASDIIYTELESFKKRTGKKVVAVMMDLAASGGYYIALPADRIVAHPTTITGSVGVIFMRPRIGGLMDKVGVDVEVSKSGVQKDMGSPFREPTDEERALFDNLTETLAARFIGLVEQHRKPSPEALATIRTARIVDAQTAKELGLVDSIGYLEDAFSAARELAGIKEARVVAYRRTEYPNDNPYNALNTAAPYRPELLDAASLLIPDPGYYYLWPAAMVR